MTLKMAVSRSRPPVPYGANLFLLLLIFKTHSVEPYTALSSDRHADGQSETCAMWPPNRKVTYQYDGSINRFLICKITGLICMLVHKQLTNRMNLESSIDAKQQEAEQHSDKIRTGPTPRRIIYIVHPLCLAAMQTIHSYSFTYYYHHQGWFIDSHHRTELNQIRQKTSMCP